MNGNKNKKLTEANFTYIINKEIEEPVAKKQIEKEEIKETGEGLETNPLPELTESGIVFFKDKKGTWQTAKVKFDKDLSYTEYSDIQRAGDEKALAIEQIKIRLALEIF